MNVLMISHIYPSTADTVSGSFVHSQVKALQELDCQVKVMAPIALAPFPLYILKAKWRKFHLTPKQDKYQGVDVSYPRIIRTPGALLFEYAGANYYHAMKRRVKTLHNQWPIDLIHAQVGYPDGWAAARLAEDLNLPLVLTLHGQELQKIVNWSHKLKYMVQQTLKQANAVVTVSPKMLGLAQQNGVEPRNLHLIYNGLDPLPDHKLPQEIKDFTGDKQVLLSVCRLEKEKGIQANIKAVHRLRLEHPNLVYVIVGDGAYRGELEKLVAQLEIQGRVVFTGQQKREQLKPYYQRADIFSMPSKDESFGIVYLEAMAEGKPIIGTRNEGIAPLIQQNNVGRLVTHGDITALTSAINDLLEPKNAKELGNTAKALSSQFTWQKNAQDLIQVYNEVTGNKTP